MESYRPNQAFELQYPEWNDWHATTLKEISAPKTLEQGCMLFVDGQVSGLKPQPDQKGFEARVRADKEYTLTLQRLPNKNPTWQCECNRGNKAAPCEHTVATLAALAYIFHQYNFINLSPIQANIDLLARSIDLSSKTSRKQLTRLRLEPHNQKTAIVRGNAALPQELCYQVNPYCHLNSKAKTCLQLPPYDEWGAVIDLHRYATEKQIQFEAETSPKQYIEIRPQIGIIHPEISFDYASKKQLVIVDSTFKEEKADSVVEYFSDEGVLLSDGTLAEVAIEDIEYLLDTFEPATDHYESGETAAIGISPENFNRLALALDSQQRTKLRKANFARNGVPVILEPGNADSTPLKLSLRIKSPSKSRKSDYAYSLDATVDQHLVDTSSFISGWWDLANKAAKDVPLMGSNLRIRKLLEISNKLPLLPNTKERYALIDAMLECPSFKKPEFRKAAKRFLKSIESNYCRGNETIPMIFKNGSKRGSTQSPWRQVQLPMAAILQIITELNLVSSTYASKRKRSDSKQDELAILQRLALVCDANEIELSVDGQPLESVAIDIDIAVMSDAKLDWFELKAEIRCGEATIPRAQWELLLQGQLLIKINGRTVIPRLDKEAAVRQLIALVPDLAKGSKHKHDEAIGRASRLDMLQWIALRREGAHVQLPPAAETIFNALLTFEGIPKRPLPRSIQAKLRDYQKHGYDWLVFLYEHRFGACLADDMGLGKTLQAITFLTYVKNHTKTRTRFLVVVPPSLLFNWRNEFDQFSPKIKIAEYAGTKRDFTSCKKADLILTTYDILRRDIKIIAAEHFEAVVFDEAQTLKNHTSRRTKAAHRLNRRFTLCLTGTPMENHPGEFHTIMELALPGLMGSYDAFQKDLREGNRTPLRRAQPFLLRRTKSAILKELPPKQETDLYLDMSKEQKEIYTRTVGEVREEVLSAYQEKTKSQAGIVALAALTRLRQTCVSPELLGKPMKKPAPKIDYLNNKLAELVDEGHSALVFSQFIGSLDCIENALIAQGLAPLRLDGSTPTTKRTQLVETFQKSKTPQVFLISLRAGGVGLNLTNASYVIHVDPWWNPAVENQASDRAHRIGQKQTVFIQRLLMRHTVEEKIMVLKKRKQALFESIVNEGSSGKKGQALISKEDFQFLLSEET
ncbi:DEAD/DEAH box helicase [Coraliomargarita algicola]|uniref:DEAD/DEAH box helicase n=1 Tax=Coraliomargarita algicola TaxID=3092156 RepID=A0ABZ0RPA6_9BACT|nr:DEAD/DEAH box helicase [Coraliomargarita sp. J2-16]WPJ96966.1 DEAD/DEAH box helicase [Coraliomargarita sp. J2-16]